MSEAQLECETIINFNEEEAVASIYTSSKRVAALLERRGLKPVRVDKSRNNGEPDGWWFEVPKWQVLIKPGNKMIKVGGRKSGASTPNRIDSTRDIGTQSAQLSS